jgi:phosphohistidine phosphatase
VKASNDQKIQFKMKRLFLLRHAEAGFFKDTDFERNLTENGIESLHRMGRVLADRNLRIDLAFCSPARRTLETSNLFQKYVAVNDFNFVQEIYDGDLSDLLMLLTKIHVSVNSCLLIGHNPTISSFLSYLTREDFDGLEPGMLVEISLPIVTWDMLGFGVGQLKEILH